MGRRTAFTLIELLVVVAIIAVLIAILVPSLARARMNVRTVVCSTNLRAMGQAQHTYAAEFEQTVVRNDYDGKQNMWCFLLAPYLGAGDRIRPTDIEATSMTAAQAWLAKRKVFQCPALGPGEMPGATLTISNIHYCANHVDFGDFLKRQASGVGGYGSGDQWLRLPQLPVNPSAVLLLMEARTRTWTDIKYIDIQNPNHMPFGGGPRTIAGNSAEGKARHLGKTTLVYFDGHAESLNLVQSNFPASLLNPFEPGP